MLFRRQREPGWMAIRLDGERIDIAHAVGGERPSVRRCESYQRSGNLVESLQRLRRSLRLERYRCTTVLPASDYQIHQVDAPKVPRAEVRQAVRWSVKDLIDYPVEAAAVDVVDIPGASAGGRPRALFAVTARNEIVAAHAQPFADADVPLEAIDIPEMVQRNLAILFETENRAVAVLAFDATGGLLTITGKGELLVSRRIEISLDRLVGAEADQRSQLLDRVALELQRSLDNFDRQFSFIALSRLLLAFVPAETGLKETLQANLDLPVEDLDLSTVLDLGRVPELADPRRQAQCLLALGAALRDEEAAAAAGQHT